MPNRRSLTQIPFEENFVLPAGYTLPSSVDLSPYFPPAGNQKRQFSCTAWASSYGLRSFQQNFKEHRLATQQAEPSQVFSPAFVYDNTRDPQDVNPCKAGAYMSNVMLFITNSGACKWSVFPYDTTLASCADPVPRSAFDAAQTYKFANPLQLNPSDVVQVKYHLAQNEPVILMACLDSTFKKGKSAGGNSDFVWQPVPGNTQCYYHAMICTGYDDADGTFNVLNSWGTGWGNRGYLQIPYAAWPERVHEAYVAGDATLAGATTPLTTLAGAAPTVGTDLTGALALGQYMVFNNIKFGPTSLNADKSVVQIDFFDNAANKPIRSVAFKLGQARVLFYNTQRITFTYNQAGTVVRNAPLSVGFKMKVENATTDPAVDGILQKLKVVQKTGAVFQMGH